MTQTVPRTEDQRVHEHANPLDDTRAFRRCLGQFATGVAIITTRHGEDLVGMAVNSFSAVSLDPPLILWSIRRESGSAPAFLEASHFAVSILRADQVEVSQAFGASRPDKFSVGHWTAGLAGVPLLTGALAHLECRRATVHEGGDHLILIGQVERYSRFDGQPLLFTQGQYAVPQTHPGLEPSPAPGHALSARTPDSSFLSLLNATNQHLSAHFDECRQSHGVTVASGRVLHRLSEQDLSLSELETSTYLGRATVEDAVRELMAQALVSDDGQRLSLTPAGRAKREALASCAKDFLQQRMKDITSADIETTRQVLSRLLAS